MDVRYELAFRMLDLDKRVSRLETLEAPGGGGGSGDLFLIETVAIDEGDEGTITFLTIPDTAIHLLYVGWLLGSGTNMYCIINGSATATDLSDLGNFTCTFGGGVTTIGNLRMGVCASDAGVGAPSDILSGIWGFIPNALGSKHLGTAAMSGVFERDDFVHTFHNGRGGGNWDSAGPIARIDFGHDGGATTIWQGPSMMSLYGLVG